MSQRRSPTPNTLTRSKSVKTFLKNISRKIRGKSPKKYNTDNQNELRELSVDKILLIDPSEISANINPDTVFPTDAFPTDAFPTDATKRKALHNTLAYKRMIESTKKADVKKNMTEKRGTQINDFLSREGIRPPNSKERAEIGMQTDKIVKETNSKERLKLLEKLTQNKADVSQGRNPSQHFSEYEKRFIQKEALTDKKTMFSNPIYRTPKSNKITRKSPGKKGGKRKSSTKRLFPYSRNL
jgi:hypothetical protein